MARLGSIIAALLLLVAGQAWASGAFQFGFTSIEGDDLPLSRFEGEAVLVVNTASLCGFTYQYGELQALFEAYRERGLVVLGVPSGDFGGQELETDQAIQEFCEVNFAIDFPLTTKSHVRGEHAHPFFRHVVEVLGPEAAPRWNFHKYLIAPDGRLVGAWPSRTEPQDPAVIAAIERVLPR